MQGAPSVDGINRLDDLFVQSFGFLCAEVGSQVMPQMFAAT